MLTVEDGTIVAGADSYTTLANARIIAGNYGWALPDDDTAAEIALRNGAQYVDMQEDCYSGTRISAGQSLAWPRQYAKNRFGFDIASDSVPTQLAVAQVAAASEYGAGTDVRATDDGKAVSHEEVVGAVVVEYFDNGKTGGTVVITKALDALRPLMVECANNGFSFRVGRA
jgi:hypothetical protein